jgi:hypothetical protein
MIMRPRLRKLALTAHVTVSVGWLGAAAAFLALAIAALVSGGAGTVRGAYVGMVVVGWYVIVPFCLAAMVTGLVVSLGTHWGLFRHYWVLLKFLITIVATLILFGFTRTLSSLGSLAADTALSIEQLRALNQSPALHSGGGLLALLVTTILAVYKPWGMTPYGLRAGRTATSSAPRGLYVMLGISGLILVLLVLHIMGGGLNHH